MSRNFPSKTQLKYWKFISEHVAANASSDPHKTKLAAAAAAYKQQLQIEAKNAGLEPAASWDDLM